MVTPSFHKFQNKTCTTYMNHLLEQSGPMSNVFASSCVWQGRGGRSLLKVCAWKCQFQAQFLFSLVKTSRYAEQILPLCFNMQNDLYMYAFMCIKQFNISRKKDSTGKEWLDHSHIPQPVIYIIDSPRQSKLI